MTQTQEIIISNRLTGLLEQCRLLKTEYSQSPIQLKIDLWRKELSLIKSRLAEMPISIPFVFDERPKECSTYFDRIEKELNEIGK